MRGDAARAPLWREAEQVPRGVPEPDHVVQDRTEPLRVGLRVLRGFGVDLDLCVTQHFAQDVEPVETLHGGGRGRGGQRGLARHAVHRVARLVDEGQQVLGLDFEFFRFVGPALAVPPPAGSVVRGRRKVGVQAGKQGLHERTHGVDDLRGPLDHVRVWSASEAFAHGAEVLFEVGFGVADQQRRQASLKSAADAFGKVVGFVHDDDELLQGEAKCGQGAVAHALVEQVVVVGDHDVGTGRGFAGHAPRTGQGRLAVLAVMAREFNQFFHVQRAGEDAVGQARRGRDVGPAGAGFPRVRAQQAEHGRALFGEGLDAHAGLTDHVHEADAVLRWAPVVHRAHRFDDDAVLALPRGEEHHRAPPLAFSSDRQGGRQRSGRLPDAGWGRSHEVAAFPERLDAVVDHLTLARPGLFVGQPASAKFLDVDRHKRPPRSSLQKDWRTHPPLRDSRVPRRGVRGTGFHPPQEAGWGPPPPSPGGVVGGCGG